MRKSLWFVCSVRPSSAIGRLPIAALMFCLALGATACGTATSPAIVTSVAVTGTNPVVGSSAQFTATASMSDGTTQNVTSLATWQSSNTAVATVSSTGLVSAVAEGSVSVQATYSSVTGIDQVTVATQ